MDKKELYKLIDLHADNPSPDHKYEHYAIAGRLVDRKIHTIEQYKKECAELGIMSYDELAKKVFHTPKLDNKPIRQSNKYIAPDLGLYEVKHSDRGVSTYIIAWDYKQAVAIAQSYFNPDTDPKIVSDGYIKSIKYLSFGEILIDEIAFNGDSEPNKISWNY